MSYKSPSRAIAFGAPNTTIKPRNTAESSAKTGFMSVHPTTVGQHLPFNSRTNTPVVFNTFETQPKKTLPLWGNLRHDHSLHDVI